MAIQIPDDDSEESMALFREQLKHATQAERWDAALIVARRLSNAVDKLVLGTYDILDEKAMKSAEAKRVKDEAMRELLTK